MCISPKEFVHSISAEDVFMRFRINLHIAGSEHRVRVPWRLEKIVDRGSFEGWLKIPWHDPDVETLLPKVFTVGRSGAVCQVRVNQLGAKQNESLGAGVGEVAVSDELLPRVLVNQLPLSWECGDDAAAGCLSIKINSAAARCAATDKAGYDEDTD